MRQPVFTGARTAIRGVSKIGATRAAESLTSEHDERLRPRGMQTHRDARSDPFLHKKIRRRREWPCRLASTAQLSNPAPELCLLLRFPELALRVDDRALHELMDPLPADAVAACDLSDARLGAECLQYEGPSLVGVKSRAHRLPSCESRCPSIVASSWYVRPVFPVRLDRVSSSSYTHAGN